MAVVVVVSQILMTFIPSQINRNKYIISLLNFKRILNFRDFMVFMFV